MQPPIEFQQLTPEAAQMVSTALAAAGARPVFIEAEGIAYQELRSLPLDLGVATGVIVGHNDGYDVYQATPAGLGNLIAEIRP